MTRSDLLPGASAVPRPSTYTVPTGCKRRDHKVSPGQVWTVGPLAPQSRPNSGSRVLPAGERPLPSQALPGSGLDTPAALVSCCVIDGGLPRAMGLSHGGHPGYPIPRAQHGGAQAANAGLGEGSPCHDPRDPLCIHPSPHTPPTIWTDMGETGDVAEDFGGAPCEPGDPN